MSLSASELAGLGAPGKVAAGAPATAPAGVTGIDMLGGVAVAPAAGVAAPGVPAAARFVDDGDAAGVRPAIATGWGVDCADGNFSSAERATAEASGAESCFHHAQRGPDWQPVSAAKAAIVIRLLFALRVMAVEPGRLSRPPDESAD